MITDSISKPFSFPKTLSFHCLKVIFNYIDHVNEF